MGLYAGSFLDGSEGYMTKLVFNSKALVTNMDKVVHIGNEIMTNTLFDDSKRFYKTICEEVSKMETEFTSSAHYLALTRLNSFETAGGAYSHHLSGVGYYRYILGVKKAMEGNDYSELERIKELYERIINVKDADILIICDAQNREYIKKYMCELTSMLKKENRTKGILATSLGKSKEAIIIPSKVNYVGLGANYRKLGYEYPQYLPVLKKYLTGSYLWDNIRVLGGAYGSMLSVDRLGTFNFVSYRDPNLKKTLDVYRNLPSHLNSLELSNDDVSKLIIGTISDADAPCPVYTTGRKLLYLNYKKTTWEIEQSYRDRLLSADLKGLKQSAEMITAVIENANISCVGNEQMIKEAQDEFEKIYTINDLR